jgi:hypothetical protein
MVCIWERAAKELILCNRWTKVIFILLRLYKFLGDLMGSGCKRGSHSYGNGRRKTITTQKRERRVVGGE